MPSGYFKFINEYFQLSKSHLRWHFYGNDYLLLILSLWKLFDGGGGGGAGVADFGMFKTLF